MPLLSPLAPMPLMVLSPLISIPLTILSGRLVRDLLARRTRAATVAAGKPADGGEPDDLI